MYRLRYEDRSRPHQTRVEGWNRTQKQKVGNYPKTRDWTGPTCTRSHCVTGPWTSRTRVSDYTYLSTRSRCDTSKSRTPSHVDTRKEYGNSTGSTSDCWNHSRNRRPGSPKQPISRSLPQPFSLPTTSLLLSVQFPRSFKNFCEQKKKKLHERYKTNEPKGWVDVRLINHLPPPSRKDLVVFPSTLQRVEITSRIYRPSPELLCL